MNTQIDFGGALNRNSPLPLFFQVRERLLALIASWDSNTSRFLTDDEIANLYGVSRTTVRQAISSLVSQGLLCRIRGSGTYVTPRRLEEQLDPAMDIRRQWSTNFLPMEIQVIAFERAPATAAEAALLATTEGKEILRVRRVRSAGGVPIALDERCIPADLVVGWTEENARGSLLHQIWQKRELPHGDLVLQAALAEREHCALLHLAPGAPVMLRCLSYEDVTGRRVLAGRTIHRADLMRYKVRIPLKRGAELPGAQAYSAQTRTTPTIEES